MTNAPANTNIYTPKNFNNSGVIILPSDTTALKTAFTAGTDGSDIRSIIVTSTDTAIRYLILWQTIAGVDYQLGELIIPVTSGSDAVAAIPSVNGLSPISSFLKLDNAGNKVLSIMGGGLLKVSVVGAVTTAKQISVICYGVDY